MVPRVTSFSWDLVHFVRVCRSLVFPTHAHGPVKYPCGVPPGDPQTPTMLHGAGEGPASTRTPVLNIKKKPWGCRQSRREFILHST